MGNSNFLNSLLTYFAGNSASPTDPNGVGDLNATSNSALASALASELGLGSDLSYPTLAQDLANANWSRFMTDPGEIDSTPPVAPADPSDNPASADPGASVFPVAATDSSPDQGAPVAEPSPASLPISVTDASLTQPFGPTGPSSAQTISGPNSSAALPIAATDPNAAAGAKPDDVL
jgi:hypothetical protein